MTARPDELQEIIDNYTHAEKTKRIFAYLTTRDGRMFITRLYRDYGATDPKAAKALGISATTWRTWRRENDALRNAANLGRANIDTMVENKLLELAMGGNLGAIIYWLKCRKPAQWRDDNKNNEAIKAVADKIVIQQVYE